MNIFIKYCIKCGKTFDRGINEDLCGKCKKEKILKLKEKNEQSKS